MNQYKLKPFILKSQENNTMKTENKTKKKTVKRKTGSNINEQNVTIDGIKRHLTKQALLNAIKGSFGIVSVIARNLTCERKTVYEWLNKKDPDIDRAFKEERESIVDLGESKLVQKINAGSESMIALVLKTLGKDRGYVEGKPKSIDEEKYNRLKELFDDISND
jgi:hypothetical protein